MPPVAVFPSASQFVIGPNPLCSVELLGKAINSNKPAMKDWNRGPKNTQFSHTQQPTANSGEFTFINQERSLLDQPFQVSQHLWSARGPLSGERPLTRVASKRTEAAFPQRSSTHTRILFDIDRNGLLTFDLTHDSTGFAPKWARLQSETDTANCCKAYPAKTFSLALCLRNISTSICPSKPSAVSDYVCVERSDKPHFADGESLRSKVIFC